MPSLPPPSVSGLTNNDYFHSLLLSLFSLCVAGRGFTYTILASRGVAWGANLQ
jgi:hypothetical protein